MPRDAVSRTARVGTVGTNGLNKIYNRIARGLSDIISCYTYLSIIIIACLRYTCSYKSILHLKQNVRKFLLTSYYQKVYLQCLFYNPFREIIKLYRNKISKSTLRLFHRSANVRWIPGFGAPSCGRLNGEASATQMYCNDALDYKLFRLPQNINI